MKINKIENLKYSAKSGDFAAAGGIFLVPKRRDAAWLKKY